MKVRSSLRSLLRQPGAQVVRRRGRLYVVNKQNPRMKGRQKGSGRVRVCAAPAGLPG